MTRMMRILCLNASLLWALTACMTGPQRTVAEGTLIGAGVGAGLGYAIEGSGEGAGWGALAGGLVGAVGGSLMAADQQAAIEREAALQGDLEALRQYNAQLADANQQIRNRIQSIDAEIAQFDRRISARRASNQQKRQWLQEELEVASALRLEAQELQTEYNRLVARRGSGTIPPEYVDLQSRIRELQRLADQYESTVLRGLAAS